MTDPLYVRDLNQIYTEMYTPSSKEKVLEEKDHDYDIPKWARVLHKHKQEEGRSQPPHLAHQEPEADAEEDENEDVGVGKYLDGLEAKNQSADHQAQQYLETIIDEVPTAVGGVNIHTVIKKAFIAGTNAK